MANDYGYFGSGSTGYAHYKQSFDRNFGGSGGSGGNHNGGGNGSGCALLCAAIPRASAPPEEKPQVLTFPPPYSLIILR